MVGLAGIVYPDAFQVEQVVTPMLKALAFRGPGVSTDFTYRDMQVGICGAPLAQHSNRIVLGLDGTIYQREALREKLASQGHPCDSEDSAELLIHAYELWDTAFLEHIDGDFALFLLDLVGQRLILARDRIGKKPLYWYQDSRYFLFASELKALLASGIVPQTPALDALGAYLYFGYIPQDMSPIQGVNKLLPGFYLHFTSQHSKVILPYWSYSGTFQKKNAFTVEDTVQQIDTQLSKSVSERLVQHQKAGCVVAGGLGSATVSYYLQKKVPQDNLTAYTVGFAQQYPEDLDASKTVTQTFHINHQQSQVTENNFLDDIVKIAWFLDEPLSDPSVIATWKLAGLAKPDETLFSGMGSDELFAGHNRYTVEERKMSFRYYAERVLKPILQPLLLPMLNLVYSPWAYYFLQRSRTSPLHLDFLNQHALFPLSTLQQVAPRLSHLFDPNVFLQKFHRLSHLPTVVSFRYIDVKTRLPDCFMLQYDRLTAAQGVKWRTPFLSQELIELLASLPHPEKLRAQDTSMFLKLILKDSLPSSFLSRPKKTRATFLQSWAKNQPLNTLFNMLPQGALVEAGIISEKWLRQHLFNEQMLTKSFRHLWGILALEIWFRLFINAPVSDHPPDITAEELMRLKF